MSNKNRTRKPNQHHRPAGHHLSPTIWPNKRRTSIATSPGNQWPNQINERGKHREVIGIKPNQNPTRKTKQYTSDIHKEHNGNENNEGDDIDYWENKPIPLSYEEVIKRRHRSGEEPPDPS